MLVFIEQQEICAGVQGHGDLAQRIQRWLQAILFGIQMRLTFLQRLRKRALCVGLCQHGFPHLDHKILLWLGQVADALIGNRMRDAPGVTTHTYDGLGRRVSVVGIDGVNRVYVYGEEGKLLYATATGQALASGTKYIYLNRHVIAEASNDVVYDHTDGLGSPVAKTNAGAGLISRTRYEPYGATAAGVEPTIGFTGHLNTAHLGLIDMQQRFYDPIAGRFLSIDPVVTDAKTGKSFNRYSYANNSPYKYIDPDGREIEIIGTAEYVKQVNDDFDRLKSKPAGMALWREINDSKQLISIQMPVRLTEGNSTTSEAHADKKPSDSVVRYNPADNKVAKDATGNTTRPAYVGLAHELGHAAAAAKGEQSKDFVGSGKAPSTPPGEVQSMKAENAVRAEHGIPERPDYYQK